MKIRVGKLGARKDDRTDARDLPFAKVAAKMASDGKLRVPALHHDARWLPRYPILDNDQYGCCTVASIVRAMINSSVRRGRPITNIVPGDVARAYLDMTGGVDEGAMAVDALTYMRNVGIKGYKVRVFARVNELDPYEMASALQTFDDLVVTAGLPARLDEDRDDRLELTPAAERTHGDGPRTLGGHAYNVFGQQRREQFVVLWEDRVVEEAAWTDFYREEAWAFIDNQETDPYLIETMEEQLSILKST